MKKLVAGFLIAILPIYFLSGCADANEPNIKEGEWKWTMTMEMAGMQMPPVSYSSCVTKEDLVPQQPNQNQQCKMLKNKTTSDSVEWEVECKSEAGKSISKGKMTYSGSTAKGEIDIITQGMTMKSKITGSRIGNCK